MANKLQKTYEFKASTENVWDALINPTIIKQYFLGTDAISDWKEGSPILYKAIWEGQTFENKGNILKLIPEKLLIVNYWTPFSGKPDSPENYIVYSYELFKTDLGTKLTLTQDAVFESEERLDESWKNWDTILNGLKEIVENN